jgi:hypothetical protein
MKNKNITSPRIAIIPHYNKHVPLLQSYWSYDNVVDELGIVKTLLGIIPN